MRVNLTPIDGLYVIEGMLFSDERGELIKPYSKSYFEEPINLNLNFKETWFTKSHKNVIRAMHLQLGELPCEKLVSVLKGSILDVILDLRADSKTFGQYYAYELNDKSSISLYIPIGCAHGYKVLDDNTLTMYLATEVNSPKDDVGIRWDSFGFDWNLNNPILSKRDLELPSFNDFTSSINF